MRSQERQGNKGKREAGKTDTSGFRNRCPDWSRLAKSSADPAGASVAVALLEGRTTTEAEHRGPGIPESGEITFLKRSGSQLKRVSST